jgi:hypothetical protein
MVCKPTRGVAEQFNENTQPVSEIHASKQTFSFVQPYRLHITYYQFFWQLTE